MRLKKLHRWLAVISIAACVALVALWIRGYRHADDVAWCRGIHSVAITASDGAVFVLVSPPLPSEKPARLHFDSTTPFIASVVADEFVPESGAKKSRMWRIGPRPGSSYSYSQPDGEWRRSSRLVGLPAGFRYSYRADKSRHAALLPLWPLVLLTMLLPLFHARMLLRARATSKKNRCPGCDYDLRATPQRCPECGLIQKEAS
jgi:hypothetical protein